MAVVTKTQFASMAGISQSLVGKMLRLGKLTENAEKKIDTDEPVNYEYLSRRKQVLAGAAPDAARYQRSIREQPRLSMPPRSADDDSVSANSDKDDLLALEKQHRKQKILETTLKNAEKTGQVVSREFVMAGFYRPCETLFTQLLGDFVKSTAGVVVPMVQAGSPRLEVEQKIQSQVSNFLKPAKARMEEAVKALYGET